MEQGEGYLANHLESDFLSFVERGAKNLDDIEHLLFRVKLNACLPCVAYDHSAR